MFRNRAFVGSKVSSWIGPRPFSDRPLIKDGLTQQSAFDKSVDIPSSYNTGWYWVNVDGTPRQLWIENSYSGGGWVLVATHPINVSIPALTYLQTTSNTAMLGSSGFIQGTSDPKQYSTFLPLAMWNSIATSNNSGRNVMMHSTSSNVAPGVNDQRRSRWTWSGWSGTYSWLGAANISNEVGGTTPGLYGYHIANNASWTTYDYDQDSYSGNCSNQFGNAPFWYVQCWDGSFWGGNGQGYQNALFWTGSGGDYYNYGAIYVK